MPVKPTLAWHAVSTVLAAALTVLEGQPFNQATKQSINAHEHSVASRNRQQCVPVQAALPVADFQVLTALQRRKEARFRQGKTAHL